MKKVLYLEDEADTEKMRSRIDLVIDLIGKTDVEIEMVKTASEALDILTTHKAGFDCLILDVLMPASDFPFEETSGGQITGIMVLKKARAMGIRCPVIIVSVKAQIQVRKLIEDLDVFEYIQKPLHASDLASAIRRAMNRG